ncbi:MAG: deoxyribose-phosphate aldolase [Nannocystaceae bacterium]|nr:deoxyribose-phosphate aldolase [Nannocystaceae bacterium]
MGKRDKQKKNPAVRAVPTPVDEHEHVRNPGTPLELEWVRDVRVNRSAVERRTASFPGRRSIKKDWQAAWLLRAIALTDLTTLAGDDTPGRVRRLCAKARNPVQAHVLEALGMADAGLTTGAVCVYHEMIPVALEALEGSNIPVAAVSAGFPAGLSPLPQRIKEIEASVAAGATEIDIVINRAHLFTGNWQAMYDEVRAFREACGDAHLKSIIATGDLAILRNVAKASLVCMMAGSDFIKTSTGKESVNATLPVSLVMIRMIRAYGERTGQRVGFKAAGGIKTAKQSLSYLALMKDELGRAYLDPELFRLGASSLLGDIERQLEHYVTGRYSADYRHPMT